jgi:hypothetical protein
MSDCERTRLRSHGRRQNAVSARADSLGLQPPPRAWLAARGQMYRIAIGCRLQSCVLMDCKLRFSQSFAGCVGAWVWAGVHVASAQCCACSHRRLSRRPRVRSALAMLSSDDNSEDGAPPARRQAMPSPLKPGAPASMTALAPLVQTGPSAGRCSWRAVASHFTTRPRPTAAACAAAPLAGAPTSVRVAGGMTAALCACSSSQRSTTSGQGSCVSRYVESMCLNGCSSGRLRSMG